MVVSVLPLEALTIAHYLEVNLSTEDLAALRAALRQRVAETQHLTWDERADAAMPCVLLDPQGCCRVYPVRPMNCRTWTSRDVNDCIAGAADPWRVTVSPVLPLLEAAGASRVALAFAAAESGVSAAAVELLSAVSCALETPRAAERWAQGERIFAGCVRDARSNDSMEGLRDHLARQAHQARA
jgi:hypothetical protein